MENVFYEQILILPINKLDGTTAHEIF
jgi:hypothetical protein